MNYTSTRLCLTTLLKTSITARIESHPYHKRKDSFCGFSALITVPLKACYVLDTFVAYSVHAMMHGHLFVRHQILSVAGEL